MDPYRFHGALGTLVRFHVLGTSLDLDPRLDLYDPNGQAIALAPTQCGAPFTSICSFQAEFAPALSGTYTLLVSDAGIDNPGGYQLSPSCLIGPCDSDLDGFFDPEPEAIGYESGPPPEGTPGISPAVDMDGFSFAGAAGTRVRFSVQGLSLDLDPRILVYNPDGTLAALSNSGECAAPFTNTCSFVTDLNLSQSGTFRVFFSDTGTDNPGAYAFSLACVLGSCPTQEPALAATCIGGNTTACRDNCKRQPDMSQADSGGVGPGSAGDGIGDLCQCGDVNDDGFVTGGDGTLVKRAALNLAPYGAAGVAALPAPQKCDVNGGTSGDATHHCSGQDGTLIQRASLGLQPGVSQFCPAADAD
jgi:hypothetical protein